MDERITDMYRKAETQKPISSIQCICLPSKPYGKGNDRTAQCKEAEECIKYKPADYKQSNRIRLAYNGRIDHAAVIVGVIGSLNYDFYIA